MAAWMKEDGIVIVDRIHKIRRSESASFNTLKEMFQKGAACYNVAPPS